MRNLTYGFIFGICLLSCVISCVCAEDTTTLSNNSQSTAVASVCNQPYAICDTAFCIPDQNDPTKMRCSCTVENGSSVGKPCNEWEPVGIYKNEYGEWMIKAGYSVGQITSTYSFVHAAPIEGNEIDPNSTPSDYTGDVYMKSCSNATGDGVWADCWDAPCTVLPQDINADITVDRPASPYAVCDCGLKVNQSEWDIAVHGTDLCDNKTLCNDIIISGASIPTTKVGMNKLATYLKENPGIDPSQPYRAGFCENCTSCASNTSADSY
ncbi:MAG: hypothetical protein LUQ07_04890 [Methanospirillum sp.]|nr:hypothetical protein [Methanospirillum sp.]